MKTRNTANKKVDSEPFEYAISLIGGKWKLNILFWLWRCEILRYGELKKNLGHITHKMLSSQLKELESDNLIVRHEYHRCLQRLNTILPKEEKQLCRFCTSFVNGDMTISMSLHYLKYGNFWNSKEN